MDLNLEAILKNTASTIEDLESTTQQVLGISQERIDIAKNQQAIADSAANAASVKVVADVTSVAEQEARRKAIAARLGTDSTAAGWILGQSADEMVAAKKNADAANEKIRLKEGINFLDNPLGYIAGQLTVKQDYADYNYWATQYNNSEKLAKDVESMTQQAFITSNALTSTVTQAYVEASKILGMHQFLKEGTEAAANGARWNMEGIIAASNLGKDKLQLIYSANNAVMQERQFQVTLAHLRQSQAQFNLQKAAHDEKLSEDALITKYIQAGFFNLNGRAMDPVRAKEAVILFKSKQPDIMDYFNAGMESAAIGGKPIVSLSPYTASTLYATSKVQNASPDQKQVLDQLVTWRRSFESPAVQAQLQLDKKDKTSMERAFNAYVEEQKKLASSNVQSGSLFAPAGMKATAGLNKHIAAMPVWKNVLAPAAATGIDVDNPDTAFGLVTAAMEQGKLSYVDATDLATIYQAGLEINNQSKNFVSVGVSPVKSYNVNVAMPNQLGKTPINLADSRALAVAINKVSANATSQIINRRQSSPFMMN